jgi:hypothetical protein
VRDLPGTPPALLTEASGRAFGQSTPQYFGFAFSTPAGESRGTASGQGKNSACVKRLTLV